MFRIGEFSKLAKTTVKTLRFYDEAGLLSPARVDEWTGYRYYATGQLEQIQQILSLREAGLSLSEIRAITGGADALELMERRREELLREAREAKLRLERLESIIRLKRKEISMDYQIELKELPACTVYSKRGIIKDMSELAGFVLGSAEECLAANPGLRCVEPDYCFVTYLDPEYKAENIEIEYSQAVEQAGRETDAIKFKQFKPSRAVCLRHKGPYAGLGAAYACGLGWLKEHGYQLTEPPRECYIDGCWNKDDEADWLTEIQFPVAECAKEVKERWGATPEYAESEKKSASHDAGTELEAAREAENIFNSFAALRSGAADAPEALELVRRWQEHICKFYYKCSDGMLLSLAEMYTGDERFKENLDRHGEGTAEFMSAAIRAYVQ